MIINRDFHAKITDWFQQNRRDLPWRHTTDPYLIWISEIILQQTRVAQGLDYYNRFVERFPNVISLAEAGEDEALKYWQGLGYYTRARNMHAAAQQIKKLHGGVFPQNYEQIRALKGVGEYTAAAICSFAYNLPYAVVDGNVHRVLARVFDISTPIHLSKGKKEFSELAQVLLDKNRSGLHNQAIMEFGALQCVPISPDCSCCPLQNECIAFHHNKVNSLPVKQIKNELKERYFNYFFIKNGDYSYLQQRTKKDIWQHLFEFPLIETAAETDLADLLVSDDFRKIFSGCGEIEISGLPVAIKHVLSHRIIRAVFYSINIENRDWMLKNTLKIKTTDLHEYPVSRLVELFLERNLN